jgi:redox-sensitive bicupin YhaK (pirin superfamily)
MSPGDLGEILKPFVFLDLFDIDLHDQRSPFSIHPHSGIATITVVVDGELQFGDVAEGSGQISFGWFRMDARGRRGVAWHGDVARKSRKAKGFQLWIALGPELEQEAVESQYVEARRVPTVGPAHVILGTYGGAHSPARSPLGITYLLVRLPAGAEWTFAPPDLRSWLGSPSQAVGCRVILRPKRARCSCSRIRSRRSQFGPDRMATRCL